MEDMLKEYFIEREGVNFIQDEFGFAIYKVYLDTCYIRDVFVNSDIRRWGHASKYADTISGIAKSKGCNLLTTSLSCLAKNSDISLKVIMNYGFRMCTASDNMIYFSKEI